MKTVRVINIKTNKVKLVPEHIARDKELLHKQGFKLAPQPKPVQVQTKPTPTPPKPEPQVVTPDVEEFKGMNAKETIEMIQGVTIPDILEEFKKHETRKTVLKAIDKRLSEI